MTTTATAIFERNNEVLELAEFSLVATKNGEIAGQLRFPPGVSRSAVRELIAELRKNGQILHQRCMGDDTQITNWSALVFSAASLTYRQFRQQCLESNIASLRLVTQEKMKELESLESELPKFESPMELEPEVEKLKLEAVTGRVQSQSPIELETEVEDLALAAEIEAEAKEAVETELATAEQLEALTLSKLKQLATLHAIDGRSAMTKNLNTAHQMLIPKLVGLVPVTEL